MSAEKKPKVLVVDDIQSNIEFVTDVLELQNFSISAANSGKEALELTKKIRPDLVLLDISMPVMNGYEVCKRIKDDPETSDIPIIFLTARVQKEDIIKGFKLGAVDYIIKPFNFNELISRVKTHVDLKQKTEQLQNINAELEVKVEERTQELRHTNHQLKKAMVELSKLDKAKTEFVLHINHELRTPLNGILGYVNLLEDYITQEPYHSHLRSIDKLTNRLIKVAELSLLFTELKTREQQLDVCKIDFNAAIMDSLDCKELSSKNIEIELENPYEEIYVKAEPKLLLTSLNILIDNAAKYSPKNSIIKISTKIENGFVNYTVSDNGPGFSEKALEEVFKFFSADNLDYNSHGFGVGLATARIIQDLIGGKIEIENKLPSGAKVNLSFPEFTEE
jgi:two-component system, sensor histidine kinase and response regulator